jgi:hypothetical protein
MLADPSQQALLKRAFSKAAKGIRHVPGQMNKLERRYSEYLTGQQAAGKIEWFSFEAITLKLAFDTRYTPDFFIMRADGVLECHECKGWWHEDAKIKIKVAAAKFPFIFIGVKLISSGWEFENFSER